MHITLSDIKRAGTWLTAICAVAYTAFSLIDIGLHIHEGWSDGVRQRDMINEAKVDCAMHRFTSVPLQKQCAQIGSTPVPVPWRIAMHHIGNHLRDKIVSALHSIVLLILTLIPIAFVLFYCMYRHHNSAPYQNPPSHQSLQDFFASYLTARPPAAGGPGSDDGCRRRTSFCTPSSGQQHVVIDPHRRDSTVIYDTDGDARSNRSVNIDTSALRRHCTN